MSITLRQLEIFVAVAETQQVTKASERLFLTQSAVSMALNELQNQLGGPLFDRRGRALLINDRGRYLLPFGKEILCQINNIETLMTEKTDKVVGALKIVASSTVGNYVLPYLIGAFKQMHPSVAIDMEVCNTGHAEELIVNGSMDLGFVEGEVSNDQISTIPWLQDELMVIASPASEIAAQETFRVPEDLERCEWIMREKGSGTAQIFKKKLGRHVTGLKVVMELGHTEAIKKAVESNAGVACLSKLAVCREVEQGWLAGLPVEGIDMKRTLQIIQYKKKASTNLMEEFINFCALLNECSQGCACLSSPWKLQDLLTKSCQQPGA